METSVAGIAKAFGSVPVTDFDQRWTGKGGRSAGTVLQLPYVIYYFCSTCMAEIGIGERTPKSKNKKIPSFASFWTGVEDIRIRASLRAVLNELRETDDTVRNTLEDKINNELKEATYLSLCATISRAFSNRHHYLAAYYEYIWLIKDLLPEVSGTRNRCILELIDEIGNVRRMLKSMPPALNFAWIPGQLELMELKLDSLLPKPKKPIGQVAHGEALRQGSWEQLRDAEDRPSR